MCGRYAASANVGELVEEFEVEDDRTADPTRSLLVNPQRPPAGTPDHNMAPTKQAPVVLARVPRDVPEGIPVRQLRLLTWGLVPGWARDTTAAARMINARVETVSTKPAYAKALAGRRCLVPATGWYEWQPSPTAVDAKGRPRKQPFYIHRADGALSAMAGIYEFWRDPAVRDPDDPSAWLVTFAVITAPAEPGLDRIHDRQPVVLDRDRWPAWLDPATPVPEVMGGVLAPPPPGRFTAYPVSPAVGSSRANGPGLLEPLDPSRLVGVVDPTTGEIIGGPS